MFLHSKIIGSVLNLIHSLALGILLLGQISYPLDSIAAPRQVSKPAVSQPVNKKPEVPKDQSEKPKGIVDTSYIDVDPLSVLKNPPGFIDKKVKFIGVFNSFDAYALDYDKALRSAKDYVAILIRRPDFPNKTIPLSELKLLFPRSKSKQITDIEPGDKILIQAKGFSSALGDAWLDVDDVMILEKTANSKKTHKKQ